VLCGPGSDDDGTEHVLTRNGRFLKLKPGGSDPHWPRRAIARLHGRQGYPLFGKMSELPIQWVFWCVVCFRCRHEQRMLNQFPPRSASWAGTHLEHAISG
jgi:hypothetical protein